MSSNLGSQQLKHLISQVKLSRTLKADRWPGCDSSHPKAFKIFPTYSDISVAGARGAVLIGISVCTHKMAPS